MLYSSGNRETEEENELSVRSHKSWKQDLNSDIVTSS